MPLDETELPEVYLMPGDLFLAHEPTIIRTILGSCVGVTFWCARLGVGALCHTMLPNAPTHPGPSVAEGGRYVDSCIRYLARQFAELGAHPLEVQVKLFGGADVLQVGNGATRPTIGRMNCESAVEVLKSEGYGVVASSLGGNFGCKIRFNTGSGEVLLLRLV